jgi:CO dehydrogenase maturation factor
VVIEPGMRSIETAWRIKELTLDLGVKSVYAIGNKVRKTTDEDFLRKNLNSIKLLGTISFDEALVEADLYRRSVWDQGKRIVGEIRKMVDAITESQ